MTSCAVAVLIVTAGLVVATGVVLARQGSPSKLSEEEGTSRSRQVHVVDRPAGPDAEAMGLAGPGWSSTAPEQEGRTMSDEMWRNSGPPTDERLADTDVEGLMEEDRPGDIPDDDRVVPEDVNEYVADEDEREA